MLGMKTQLAMPNAADFCTLSWAANTIGVSRKTIERMIEADILHVQKPRSMNFERDPQLLLVIEVEEVAEARRRLARG
jgi:hypothetical protein